jgi:hypothetical protein
MDKDLQAALDDLILCCNEFGSDELPADLPEDAVILPPRQPNGRRGQPKHLHAQNTGKKKKKPGHKIAKIRDSHHWLARALASGKNQVTVARETGYSNYWISVLLRDPAFVELVEQYRKMYLDRTIGEEAIAIEMMRANFIKFLRLQSDILDDAAEAREQGQPISDAYIRNHLYELADRLGYGKSHTSINVSVEGLADRMAAARKEFLAEQKPKLVLGSVSSAAGKAIPPSPPGMDEGGGQS